jgi:MFS family permease
MGIYQIGIYLGSASALVIGGVIFAHPAGGTVMVPLAGAMKGWQLVFLLLGIPGLLLTLVTLTLRTGASREAWALRTGARSAQFFAHIGARAKAYIGIMLGFALMVLVGNGTAVWIPAFLERSYGWTTAQVGSLYGPVVFVCGTSGALTGGLVASWLRKRGLAHGNLQASMIGFTALVPVTIAFPLMPTAGMALVLIGLMNFLAGFNFGGGLATLQELTPNRMRALMSAAYMLTINLIGAALGPTAIALVTDYGFHDPKALHYAISIVCAVASPLSVVLLWMGMKDYRRIIGRGALRAPGSGAFPRDNLIGAPIATAGHVGPGRRGGAGSASRWPAPPSGRCPDARWSAAARSSPQSAHRRSPRPPHPAGCATPAMRAQDHARGHIVIAGEDRIGRLGQVEQR